MPQPLNNPPGGPAQSPVFQVPYPASGGTAGPMIQLATYSSIGINQPIGIQMAAYTEDWLEILNLSDSVLQPMWDTGAQLPPIPQGYAWATPIPNGATKLSTVILSQTPTQQFPQEILLATYYTRQEIAQGFLPRAGPLVPSVPAASIGPGALPEGVTIGADDVTAETFKPGVIIPAAQVGVAAPDPMALNDVLVMTLGSLVLGILVIEPSTAPSADIAMYAGRVSGDTRNRVILYFDHTTGYGGIAAGPGGATAVTGHLRATASGWEILESLLVDGNLTVTGTGGAIPGATITGDIAASQVGPGALDTDVTMSANQLTAGTLAGSIVVPGGDVSGSVATAKQVDNTNSGSTTVPQLATGTAGAGINAKDNSGGPFVELVPTAPSGQGRGIQLDFQDNTGTLHEGLLLDDTGVTTFFNPTKNSGGDVFHVSSFFNGTGPGTFSHGLSVTPKWVGITSTVLNSSFTVGVDTIGATTVHVNIAAGETWIGVAMA